MEWPIYFSCKCPVHKTEHFYLFCDLCSLHHYIFHLLPVFIYIKVFPLLLPLLYLSSAVISSWCKAEKWGCSPSTASFHWRSRSEGITYWLDRCLQYMPTFSPRLLSVLLLMKLTVMPLKWDLKQRLSGHLLVWVIWYALILLMGNVVKPTLKSYWSTEAQWATPFFSLIMSRDRFFAINQFLHFVDNSLGSGVDRLFKIRLVLDHLCGIFRSAFVPGQYVAIDESLLLWRETCLETIHSQEKTKIWHQKLRAVRQ